MCSQNLKRRISDRNYNNDEVYDDLRHSKCVKFDSYLAFRKTQPRSNFPNNNKEEEFHGSSGKLISRNCHNLYYGNRDQGDQRTNSRSRVGYNKNEQQIKNYVKFQHSGNYTNQQESISQRDTYKQQNFTQKYTNQQQNFSQRDTCKSSVINGKGKGNWDLACALAYRYLFGDFVAQNEGSDYSSGSPSTSTTSTSSKCSENSLDLNQLPEDDDGVNFALYLLGSTTTPAATVKNLTVPNVINPTQAAYHWFSASH